MQLANDAQEIPKGHDVIVPGIDFSFNPRSTRRTRRARTADIFGKLLFASISSHLN
jgi:hypothetical protein